MNSINKLPHPIIATYSRIGLVLRWSTYLIIFLFGCITIGPFLISTPAQRLFQLISENPILSLLLDPTDWILDQIIKNLAVITTLWTCIFLAYWKRPNSVDNLNTLLKYTPVLTRGLGTLLISLFMLLAGIGMSTFYPIYIDNSGFITIVYALALFGAPGLYISHYSKLHLKASALLDTLAPYAAALCGLITLCAVTYTAMPFFIKMSLFIL